MILHTLSELKYPQLDFFLLGHACVSVLSETKIKEKQLIFRGYLAGNSAWYGPPSKKYCPEFYSKVSPVNSTQCIKQNFSTVEADHYLLKV